MPIEEPPIHDCRDCGVKPGELHTPGCDKERCRRCGGQAISCGCIYQMAGDPDVRSFLDVDDDYEPTEDDYAMLDTEVEALGGRLPWTGIFPGTTDAIELDLWCYWGPDATPPRRGWVECTKDHPLARPDLNRLHFSGKWDAKLGKFVKR